MFRKKKNARGISWEYIKKRHSTIVNELKSLSGWDNIKASVVEAESLGEYSLVSLYVATEVYRETRSQIEYLSEKVESINSRLESIRSENAEKLKQVERDIKEIKEKLEELEKRTLFLGSIEKMIPRLTELEEKLEAYPSELITKLEKTYGHKINEEINQIVQERLKLIEEDLKRGIFGVSVDLAETLKEIQGKYEKIILENYTLREELKEKDLQIAELTQRLTTLQKQLEIVNDLDKKLEKYRKLAEEFRRMKESLIKITGIDDVDIALEELKEYVPKTKIKPLLDETKRLLAQIEELKKENEQLREENRRLESSLKKLLGKESPNSEF
ncbi:hypothetical protein OCC_10479 [Thermococcus litoralis DSM 5473]|uniref:Uncharacterized protein n=1 Tax=Thermococcus litoralis (strain ATCC 51850 / DSM 5473 / JCM 8560 / NS-C) TaxID=523849 RepID=H3ZR56_THELN|nr:hypothetical protein [Thermococcus litoralis]EHR77525.1 hypothetical protein OCC_10479 [Thermococcus litoralis DSM 5473]